LIFALASAARRDFERLREFLLPASPAVAARAASHILQAIWSLEGSPDRGRPSSVEGARELIVPFGRSSYIVRYVHDREVGKILVLRIWHSRENRA
jgi:plasmid stabilization system protein ParE